MRHCLLGATVLHNPRIAMHWIASITPLPQAGTVSGCKCGLSGSGTVTYSKRGEVATGLHRKVCCKWQGGQWYTIMWSSRGCRCAPVIVANTSEIGLNAR